MRIPDFCPLQERSLEDVNTGTGIAERDKDGILKVFFSTLDRASALSETTSSVGPGSAASDLSEGSTKSSQNS